MKKVIFLLSLLAPQLVFACGPDLIVDPYIVALIALLLFFACYILFSLNYKKGKIAELRFFAISKFIFITSITFATVYFFLDGFLSLSICMPMDRDIFVGNHQFRFCLLVILMSIFGLLLIAKTKQIANQMEKVKYLNILMLFTCAIFIISIQYVFFALLKDPHHAKMNISASPAFVVPDQGKRGQ